MNIQQALILCFIFAGSEGCHLSTACRKKRNIQEGNKVKERGFSIHGGCTSERMLFLDINREVPKILEKYGLRNQRINSRISSCIANEKSSKEHITAPFQTVELHKYYYMYSFLRASSDCTTHYDKCKKMETCIIDLIIQNHRLLNLINLFRRQKTGHQHYYGK